MCFIWCESILGLQLSICPHQCCSANESPQVCRTDIRTRDLPCGRQANRWTTPHPVWSTSHPSELHPLELCHAMSYTMMSYATPWWATPHPNELRHHPVSYATPHDLQHTPMSYATPRWATSHHDELCHTPMSYTTPQRATPHPMSYATPRWPYTTPQGATTHPHSDNYFN